ncbi:hypothetical protein [Stutzerimonas stutzeri]|uniref:hypothetical protein n=1 Tax=Stutzerimonas stutzeri TaxID=316 RepID=UPI0015E403B6|nr:hypothetical protein [Stutzerimonas stutzeri]MBA1280222.1 hypothetical protein [Stutzerimonas stutzeri]
MAYTFVDRMMDGLDELRRGWRGWTKADHSQYFPVACAHSDNVLALYNGSLMSVIRIDGYLGQYFPEQFKELRHLWTKFLRTTTQDKSAKGFDLFWSYEYDPEGMASRTLEYRERMILAGERRGLEVRDIMEEEARLYGSICASEEQYLLIVTHIDSLPKANHKEALSSAAQDRSKAAKGHGSMVTQRGLKMIEATHEQHVNKVEVFLKGALRGYTFERMNAYSALHAMRHSLLPETTGPGWKARLTLKDCRFRPTEDVPDNVKQSQGVKKVNDWTFMLPPPLTEQMTPPDIVDLGRYVVIGDRTYAPLFVSELAVEPEPIENLLRMCYQRRLPIRMVYSLMSNSEQANYWNRMFASIFNFASSSNRQIDKADRAMKAYAEGAGSVFGYGISVTTWAATDVRYDSRGAAMYDVKSVAKRAQDVETLMQQWGGQQLDSIFGCSVEAAMSATPGYMIPPACPKAPQIEMDVIAQLPIMRPAKLWSEDNSIWMRSSDGVLLPYQPFSGKQNTMISLILGGMGFGKSNFISENISYFANHPEADMMPYIRGMDFGASSSGVVGMVHDSLPENRKHEALFIPFSNTSSMCKNMMDTRLGMRYPLEDHKKFLINWLVILCDSLIEAAGIQNLVAVLNATIENAYANCDPRTHHFQAKPFRLEQADDVVVAAVERAELKLDEHTIHWDVVDALIAFGLAHNDSQALHAAKVAQRHCVPLFPDLVRVCDQLEQQFVSMPDIGGKSLCAAVANAITNANAMFPVFSGVTTTDISESRICVFDMTEAFGRGETEYDAWVRSVYFAVVHRLLTEDLFINQQISGKEMVDKRMHFGMSEELLKWHLSYFERQDQLLKLYWADELHRVGRVNGAFQIIDSMGFEGRKYRVGLALGTQLAEYLPKSMIELATSIFIFGTSQSSETANKLQDLFALSNDERQIALDITKPDAKKGAEVFVIHKTNAGIQRAKLHFQVGNIKRWAYATEPNERALRGRLYALGKSQAWARKVLAEKVPDLEAAIKAKQKLRPEVSQKEAILLIADELLHL